MLTNELAHSEIGPSGFDRVFGCPGSVAKCRGLTKADSEWSIEGTRSHRILEECLKNNEPDAADYVGQTLEAKGVPFVGTEEQAASATKTLELVHSILEPEDYLYAEDKLDLSFIEPGVFGTCDVRILKIREQWLHVIDHKHGAGVVVEVDGNKQLRGYALAALKAAMAEGHKIQKVTIWISQPRAPHEQGPYRSETFHAFDLLEWADELKAAIARAKDPNAKRCPGKWCKFCPAADAFTCEEFKRDAVAAACNPFDLVLEPSTFDAKEMAYRLEQAPKLATYLKKLKAAADKNALAGHFPEGWGYYPGKGRRAWLHVESTIAASVKAATGHDFTEFSYPSPAQVEERLGAAEYKRVCLPLVEMKRAPSLQKAKPDKPPMTLEEVQAFRAANKSNPFDEIEHPD